MMWAAISHTEKTTLVHIPGNLTAQRYCDEILQPHVLPLIQQNDARFQHVNARPHTARITTALLTNSIVAMLPWPSKSPDLKPIEHLWDDLDRRVRQRKPQPESLHQLMNALQDEWNNIPQQVIRTLITPMGRAVRLLLIHVVDIRDIEL
jgi:transposase